jgi:hypothetical protein
MQTLSTEDTIWVSRNLVTLENEKIKKTPPRAFRAFRAPARGIAT